MEFTKIRQALEEHLSAINDNTAEIQALFDYLQELEVKVDKVNQRLDSLQLSADKAKPSSLTLIEKKVFLVLYTEEMPLVAEEIAVRAEMPPALVPECLSQLGRKGVPLQRTFMKDQLFWCLDRTFKERQAKENLINLSLQSFM